MKEEKRKVDYKEIVEKIRPKIEKEVELFFKDLRKIHAQKITPSILDDVKVEMFGQKFPIFQLGTISISGPRELFIQVWDKSYLEPIQEALQKANFSAVLDKDGIRINFPPLSEEFRQNLLKMLSQKKEILRRKIRNLREKAWNEIQQLHREKKISDDEKYKAKEELQKIVDEYQEKVEEALEKKEKEIKE